MNQDAVLRARMRLLSVDRRVLRGREGLAVYRLLTEVSPAVYGSKLAKVLVEASRSYEVRDKPQARRALLEKAVRVASALDPSNPFRDKTLGAALAALRAEVEAGIEEPPPSA
ncbi:hypothetical protein [Kitasatospora camelliae]|uniref:Uncharacterized protein n=1 Tax=Kitasatospora camelliae TaxID=3156397 RepID=A0AAU8K485_9ACTN